jgi:hypothetical protein
MLVGLEQLILLPTERNYLHSYADTNSRGFSKSGMDSSDSPQDGNGAGNGPPNVISGADSISGSTPQSQQQSTTPGAVSSAWSQMSTNPANNSSAGGASFPQYSASTAAILERLQGKNGHASGSAAFEAKRAEILQNYVTSDKLPTPPPISSTPRRGRGGRVGTPSGLKTEVAASPSARPPSSRGSARGRGRGRGGRRGGRGGKRKRSESDEESDVSVCLLNIESISHIM